MNEITEGKKSLRQEFSSLTTKQTIGIIAAITISLILEALGFASMCIGFLIVAIILYMVPHLLGVTSVKLKVIIGVVFIVLSILLGTFAYMDINKDTADSIDNDTKYVRDVSYDPSAGKITMILSEAEGSEFKPVIRYGPVDGISFGALRSTDQKETEISYVKNANGTYSGTADLNLEKGKYYRLSIFVDADKKNGMGFTIDTGISSGDMIKICFVGAAYLTAYIASMYFIILIFSALMRRSINKTRTKMEEEGRLYPKGYGRCKKCGAVVLPGEVNCRKCGEYIDVPEELRPNKKDRFLCSECGCEVSGDAKSCPKCGKTFDEDTETVVRHADGSEDTAAAYIQCPGCGETVPDNVKRCPKCGKTFEK